MGKSAKKATRKFEKNHLRDALERRKEVAKIKQRQLLKAKKQARREKDGEFETSVKRRKVEGSGDSKEGKEGKDDKNPFSDMTVDEFFQGGFAIQEMTPLKGKTGKKNGKRKREEVEAEEEEIEIEGEVDSLPGEQAFNDNEVMSDEDTGMNQEALDALKEKDPEFYKYLKENDAELLDFDEDADIAEMDRMSASDQEDVLGTKTTKSKKKKKKKKKKERTEDVEEVEEELENEGEGNSATGTKVTEAMVSKWKNAMVDQHSLRAMRQVVLAFRAAAHVNEDSGKSYRYTISNPEGKSPTLMLWSIKLTFVLVFHELLVITLKHVPGVLNNHLPIKTSASGKELVVTFSHDSTSLLTIRQQRCGRFQEVPYPFGPPQITCHIHPPPFNDAI
jgi:nucleolar complex protein 2